jgi:hypothetical protein
MRVLRKVIALLVYGALLMPFGDSFRITAWLRAVSVTSTAFDSTLRRRQSRIENARMARHLQLLRLDAEYEERTLRGGRARYP